MENDQAHRGEKEKGARAMAENQGDNKPTASEDRETIITVRPGPGNMNILTKAFTSEVARDAARENWPDILKKLIEAGKSTRGSDKWGWTALHHAAFNGHTECLKILLNEDTSEMDIGDKDKVTPTNTSAGPADLWPQKGCQSFRNMNYESVDCVHLSPHLSDATKNSQRRHIPASLSPI